MKRVAIKVNHGIPGHKDGQVVRVDADDEGVPLDFEWRRRLRAAERDQSCEVVKPEAERPEPPPPEPDPQPRRRRRGAPDSEE